MKLNIHHLYYLFYPRGWIILVLLFSTAVATAQESATDEFIIGSGLSSLPWRRTQWDYYTSYDSCGFNAMVSYSKDYNKSRLDKYNLVANNTDLFDWIMYYSTCYYSKWEAEQNQTDKFRVGIKHKDSLGNTIGDTATWKGIKCWSTIGLTAPACSLMYGPHYRQDNRYKSWQHDPERHNVKYYTTFHMALNKPETADTTLPVCKIKVVYRFQRHINGQPEPKKDTLFLTRTLTVADFPDSGKFDYFKFDHEWYQYPQNFWLPKDAGKLLYVPEDVVWYNDINDDIGIQFWVEWLVNAEEDSGYTLYIDNVEVYDEDWKTDFIEDPQFVADRINNYAKDYCDWSNLKYWIGSDEPFSLDAYTPIKTVDALLDSVGAPRLLTTFYPWWESTVNGYNQLERYYNTLQPKKLMIDFFPFSRDYSFRLEALKRRSYYQMK